jgi:hypothetical protein
MTFHFHYQVIPNHDARNFKDKIKYLAGGKTTLRLSSQSPGIGLNLNQTN